jgi:hypothetical protein
MVVELQGGTTKQMLERRANPLSGIFIKKNLRFVAPVAPGSESRKPPGVRDTVGMEMGFEWRYSSVVLYMCNQNNQENALKAKVLNHHLILFNS